MRVRRASALLGVVLGCLLTSGCAVSGPTEDDAAAAATAFTAAIAAGDGEAACDLLSPGAVASLTKAPGSRCSDVILSLTLPDGGRATSEEVFGRAAFVHVQNDTLFLTVSSGSWKVRAAGCSPEGDAPYDCMVKGD